MAEPKISVLKLGGSVLEDEGSLGKAVHRVYHELRRGRRVVAVVSALGGVTDRLLATATRVQEQPEARALARLLATGEAQSVGLLGLALDRAGVSAHLLDAGAIGLRASGPPLDAALTEVDAARLRELLASRPVAVVPGFVGLGEDAAPLLLGRGGSDLSALFLAAELGAECRLLKDVDGLYQSDPALPGPPPPRYRQIGFDDALALDEGIVQHKALRFARERGLRFRVGGAEDAAATLVGATDSRFATPAPPKGPLRVGLLGCGAVGGGVLRHLLEHPAHFELTGIAVRRPDRLPAAARAAAPVFGDPQLLLAQRADVLVELIGGLEPARGLIQAALRTGRHVVTANKELLSAHGRELHALARSHGARLGASASGGGARPAREAGGAAAERGPVEAIEGVLNGTTNFLLDRLGEGQDFDQALRLARELGIAEADPEADLSGRDALHKLVLLAREAFDERLDPEAVDLAGIDLREAGSRGIDEPRAVTRLVARCRRQPDGSLRASVSLEAVALEHPFAAVRDEGNALLIESGAGPVQLWTGKGAGRWPTAEAVLADLLELHHVPASPDPRRRAAVA